MRKWTEDKLKEAAALAASGLTSQATAETLSLRWGERISRFAVANALSKRGVHFERAVRGHRDTVRTMPPAEKMSDTLEEVARIAEVVAAARKGTTLEDFANRFDVSPRRATEMLEEAKERGYAVHFDARGAGKPPPALADETHVVDTPGDEHTIAVFSDIHIGSKYFLKTVFRDAVRRAYDDGARIFLGPGDTLDGCYRHSRWEWTHDGFEAQAEYATEVIEELPGARWFLISGNHDETFEEAAGLSVCRSLTDRFRAKGRTDVTWIGERGAYVRLRGDGEHRGFVAHLWHPRGQAAYALSYHLQKKIEGYAVGAKPDALFAGHWHTSTYFPLRGVHAFACGTFHGGGGAFGNSLKGAPSIGHWLVKYRLTDKGAVRELSPSWRGYLEREAVRDVEMG